MKRAKFAILILILVLFSSPIIVWSETCETSKSDYWICTGDRAWLNGYLVSPSKMEELIKRSDLLDEVKKERDEYRALLDEMKNNRDQFILLGDELKTILTMNIEIKNEYKNQRDGFELDLISAEKAYMDKQVQYEQCIADGSDSWSVFEVSLLTTGVSILSVLAGMGVYAAVF